jgi:hypothetical protein
MAMAHGTWFDLVPHLGTPRRPELARASAARDAHVARRRISAEARARAKAACEVRIERARAAVFAGGDGVVGGDMTALEREWRQLARPDDDGVLMDLWAEIAPRAWHDQKRWRGAPVETWFDLAVALASDPEGVEAAERAARALREALAPWGGDVGPLVSWRFVDADGVTGGLVTDLLAAPCAAIRADLGEHVVARGLALAYEVYEAVAARRPDRPDLVDDVRSAAFFGMLWDAADAARTAARDGRPNPVTALRELWRTGATLLVAGPEGFVLGIPPLAQPETTDDAR